MRPPSSRICLVFALTLLMTRDAAAVERLRLDWAGAAKAVAGKKVTVTLRDKSEVAGRVVDVAADTLLLDRKAPKRIARPDVATIEFTRHGFAWRLTGTTVGFFAGGLIGYQTAVRTFGDNSGAKGVNLAVAVMAGITILGYLIGRQADRKTVLIEIIPAESPDPSATQI